MTCSDCHDPHTQRLRATGNALCTQCHSPARFDGPSRGFHSAGGAGAACVGCHMPMRTYMLVDGRRDHSIRVPRPDLSIALGVPNACTTCHTERSGGVAAIAADSAEPPIVRHRRWPDSSAARELVQLFPQDTGARTLVAALERR